MIFHNADWKKAGFSPVVTGIEYETSESQTIKKQWCYVYRYYDFDGRSSVQEIRVDLGSIHSGNSLQNLEFSEAKHGGIDVSKSDFEQARKLCQFDL